MTSGKRVHKILWNTAGYAKLTQAIPIYIVFMLI